MCSPSVEAKEEVVVQLRQKIENEKTTLPEKYRCLFSLRNLRNDSAHDALVRALQDESALFRHDVAFCLGQRQDEKAVKVLCDILADAEENPMVRHEAAEALGAIATPGCLTPLQQHHDDPVQEVAETCQLALQRLEFLKHHPGGAASADRLRTDENPYNSVDPTPALPKSTPLTALQELALDEAARMFDRYTAMFALRNIGSRGAIEALGRMFTSRSALLKHEVAYVMGQIQSPHAVDVLTKVLKDQSEHAMVRHEAAEALGSIADPACQGVLRDYCSDPEPIVAHSCVVALDVMDHESSGQLEYANCAS